MFTTMPGSQLTWPKELETSPSLRWRAVECPGPSFFFVVLTFHKDEPGTLRTILVSWDSDLVHLVESPGLAGRLHCVRCLPTSECSGSAQSLPVREIKEIWRGIDRAAQNAEVIIFRTTEGEDFCGAEILPVPSSVEMVGRIAQVGAR
jgi:hypothetical protein